MQHNADLLASLHNGGWYRREYHADCPFCGKEVKAKQTHFSVFQKQHEWLFKCHVCGEAGGMGKLAHQLGVANVAPRTYQRHQEAPKPRTWQQNPTHYLTRFCESLDRVDRWQSYKPLTLDSIGRYRLGVGVLPSSRCSYRRLIVPVFDGSTVVAFHGRAFLPDDTDAKWLTSGGSRKDVLYNGQALAPGATVIICENLIDCILAMQQRPDVVAVASGGVGWTSENGERWLEQIAASRPKQVIVWFDNDLPGQANEPTRHNLERQWRVEQARRLAAGAIKSPLPPPEPVGPTIANALLKLRQRVHLYQWPRSAPAKADLGWALTAA